MNLKRFFLIPFAIFCTSLLCAESTITDWKGRISGMEAEPLWLEKLVENGTEKPLRKKFKLAKSARVFYAQETSEVKEIAILQANLNVKKQVLLTLNKDNKTENENLSAKIEQISGLTKIYETWQQIEDDDNSVYYEAFAVYKLE